MTTTSNHTISRRTRVLALGALVLGTALMGAVVRVRGSTPAAASRASFVAPGGGPVSFSGTLDRTAVLRGGDGLVRMELVIGGEARPDDARVPTDLVVVLDRSGSMAGEKIANATAAVRALIAELAPADRFALVTYSTGAALAVPLGPADERARTGWLGSVAGVTADGNTNMSSGLELALDVVERGRLPGRVPRVILISDGLANQGDASPEGLARRARRAAEGEYMLSTIGVGADFNEYLMRALADAGTGNYYYLASASGLEDVFAREFGGARATVASGLAVDIAPAAGVRVVDAGGYPLETSGQAVTFRPGALFAGQTRHVWVTFAVPSATLGRRDLGRFTLAYAEGAERRTLGFEEEPVVECVGDPDVFYGAIDREGWTRSILFDAYNQAKEKAARAVKAGRRDEARQALDAFRKEAEGLNARVQSAPVRENLRALGYVEGSVDAAFEGADQAGKQNELSKSMSAEALDARRAGSK
jgi:Ca-activated chloride channel family protein